MVAARILGYGKDYPIKVSCPKCSAANSMNVDLTSLPEQNVPENVVTVAPGIFEFILPQSKRIVHFRLITGNDEKKLTKDLESSKKAGKFSNNIDRELTTRLKAAIVSVDGNADRVFVNEFVDNQLFAMDSRAFRTYMKTVSPDLKFEIPFTCTECGHEEEALAFGIDTNFFWPKS